MSTQINVTVDSGGLSDRAKQQQQAARQAQLEKERTLNLSAEALDKRVAAKAAQGLSVDGQPLYGTSFKQPQIERRPAATRTAGGINILFVPKNNYNNYGSIAETRQIKNNQFTDRAISSDGSIFSPGIGRAEISAKGPNSNLAWVVPDRPDYATASSVSYYLDFLATDTANVEALGGQVFYGSGTNVIANGVSVPPAPVANLKNLKTFTVEALMRVAKEGGQASSSSGFSYARFTLESKNADNTSNSTLFYVNASYNAPGVDPPNMEIFMRSSIVEADALIVNRQNENAYPVPQGSWKHVACVKDANNVSFFFDGQLIAQAPCSTVKWGIVTAAPYLILSLELGSFVTDYSSGLQGLRFTPKPLYSANFTPPTAITSFA